MIKRKIQAKVKAKRKQKTDNQKWIARLDALASEYVRKRAMVRGGGCERCHQGKASWKNLQWAHYRGKNKHGIRWDPSNAAGLDGGCHRFFDEVDPKAKVDFFRVLLGQEEFDRLNLRAEFIVKYTKTDYKLWEIYLTQKLEELERESQGLFNQVR